MKITADSCQRQGLGARQKMKKRLFLNGVNIYGTGISVHDAPEQAIDIDSHPAIAALARRNHATLRT
jgi:hypothetical protein